MSADTVITLCLAGTAILNMLGIVLVLWRQHNFVYVTGRLLDRIRTLEKLSSGRDAQ